MRAVFLTLCVLLASSALAEQQAIQVHAINAVDREKGVLNSHVETTITHVEETRVVVEGQAKKEVKVLVPVARETTVLWTLDDYQVLDHEGRVMKADQIWLRVKPGALVFRVEQRSFKESFLKTLGPTAIVLLLREKQQK